MQLPGTQYISSAVHRSPFLPRSDDAEASNFKLQGERYHHGKMYGGGFHRIERCNRRPHGATSIHSTAAYCHNIAEAGKRYEVMKVGEGR
jgi:hypothetical protein